jgi:hypothetical protein
MNVRAAAFGLLGLSDWGDPFRTSLVLSALANTARDATVPRNTPARAGNLNNLKPLVDFVFIISFSLR